MDAITFCLSFVASAAGTGFFDDPAHLRLVAYGIFLAFVLAMLALDLGVFHREAHEVSLREAMGWSIVWLSLGVLFTGAVYIGYERHWLGLGLETPKYNPLAATEAGVPLIVRGTVDGWEAAKQYLTGYVVEKSLAMDNIFVIAIVFSFFAIPRKYQHRVLFWGILGALVMRGAMILIGAALIMQAMWILIIFGAFLILTALKMALVEGHTDPGRNIVVRLVRRFYPVYPGFDGQRFFTVVDGVRHVTPLFLALVMVEITDLIFAVDSIPAIFAITPDPFIVFTSNIFAILGLRSLYFCLAAMIAKFRYLKPALILILAFVGVKLLLLSVPPYLPQLGSILGLDLAAHRAIKIDTTISLAVVLGLLGLAVALSALRPAKAASAAPHGE
ncbi:MAG TPA: TerC family protein [Phycisphaerales bacterium]|nr:TerC family protein [Phycisphaerales bacterium]HMP38162.1 TerC family protein [Phycisphaerales bacterium]